MSTPRIPALVSWTAGSPGEMAAALLARGVAGLRRWWRVVRTRPGLAELDDRMLQDLGISRAQWHFEMSRAPWDVARRR